MSSYLGNSHHSSSIAASKQIAGRSNRMNSQTNTSASAMMQSYMNNGASMLEDMSFLVNPKQIVEEESVASSTLLELKEAMMTPIEAFDEAVLSKA